MVIILQIEIQKRKSMNTDSWSMWTGLHPSTLSQSKTGACSDEIKRYGKKYHLVITASRPIKYCQDYKTMLYQMRRMRNMRQYVIQNQNLDLITSALIVGFILTQLANFTDCFRNSAISCLFHNFK